MFFFQAEIYPFSVSRHDAKKYNIKELLQKVTKSEAKMASLNKCVLSMVIVLFCQLLW
jgi:hypothetical protein